MKSNANINDRNFFVSRICNCLRDIIDNRSCIRQPSKNSSLHVHCQQCLFLCMMFHKKIYKSDQDSTTLSDAAFFSPASKMTSASAANTVIVSASDKLPLKGNKPDDIEINPPIPI